MIKLTSIFFIYLFFFARSYSQDTFLRGTVKDTIDNVNLKNAVIYLKRTDNSKLVAYTRADEQGDFRFSYVLPGTYLMVVSYIGYVDWIDSVKITGLVPLNLTVFLTTQTHLLEEVIIKQRISPIRIKGDTTEFLADSFHVPPGATVEDLLKVLPGISVDAKGRIKADGRRVQNVLVDGEEFFGNDPTMATQNLNKSDVAKVQVYDKKSNKAIITGIEDGDKEKTINVVLKDDAKKGYFGELSGGSDFNNYYQGKATISRFTSTLKIGALFLADRTGRDVDNGDFGNFEGRRNGISEIVQGAAMVNKKFGRLGNSTANNFAYNHIDNTGNSYTAVQYILPNDSYYSNQYNTSKNVAIENLLNSQNTFRIDSSITLTANIKYTGIQSSNKVFSNGSILASDNATFINTSEQRNISSTNIDNGNIDLFLKKLINKSGTRFFTIGTSLSSSHNERENFLFTKAEYYSGGIVTSQQITDQKKVNTNETNSGQLLASYVAPLSKIVSMNINYTFNASNSDQDIRTYENNNGKYDSINLLYSNHFRFLNVSHQGGTTINFAGKKMTAKAGVSIQDIVLKQTDLYTDSFSTRAFINIFPTAGLGWKYSKTGNLNLNYNGKMQQPTLNQLQPIRNNDDPLNIQVGNSLLKPAFSHSFGFDFSNFKQVTGRLIRGYVNMTVIQNDFSSKSTIDNQGRRVYQSINVNGNYSYGGGLTFFRSIIFFGTTLNITLTPSLSRRHYTNFINNTQNSTDVSTFSHMLYIIKSYTSASPLDIQFTYLYQLNNSKSSISKQYPVNYHIQDIGLYLAYLPKSGWRINSNHFFSFRQKLSPGDVNTNAMIWSVSVEKRLSKKNNIAAILKLNDIFNQNIGFSRSITSTSVTENTNSTIQRFVLLSLRWKFTKNRNHPN